MTLILTMQQSHHQTLILVAAVGFAATLTLHVIQPKLEPVAEIVTETDPIFISMTCCGVAL